MHYNDDKLFEYLDGFVKPSELDALKDHLSQCQECKDRLNELSEFNRSLSKLSLSDEEISVESKKIFGEIYKDCIDEKNVPFYKKAISVPLSGLVGCAAAFVMITIGSIMMFNPRSNDIVKIVPGANPTIDKENVYKVGDVKEMTIEDHIKAIEDMGYGVTLEPLN